MGEHAHQEEAGVRGVRLVLGVVLAGFFMLYCAIVSVQDRHPNAGAAPEKQDEMSVPYK